MEFGGAVGSLMLLVVVALTAHTSSASRCEPMTFSECSFGGKHKLTTFPNKRGDQNMEDAIKQYRQFSGLLQLKCSPLLHQFICFYMFPSCSDNAPPSSAPMFPCRSTCELVKAPCDQSLRTVDSNFKWDMTEIQCETLRDTDRCISPTTGVSIDPLGAANNLSSVTGVAQMALTTSPRSVCDLSVMYYHNTYVQRCGAHVLFNAETKEFTSAWMFVWACVCCIASLLTFITILRDKQRFPYPERPVMFLALCYFGYSLAYITRAMAGAQKVSCEMNQKSSYCGVLVREDMQPLCMVVFIVSYYFSLSAAAWWLMFTVGWLLSAAVKWSSEAIESRSSFFHLFAWAAPACLTSVVIVMRKVEGDELTGLCLVGVSKEHDLLLFQIVPHAILLCAGVVLLSAGFIAMTRIRSVLAEENGAAKVSTDKLEKLIVKVAVSAGFYIVPNLAILACNIYQFVSVPTWNAAINRTGERMERRPASENLPLAELFIFKIFMSFAVGISLLMWICSAKTLQSWRQCFIRRSDAAHNKRYKPDPVPLSDVPSPTMNGQAQAWGTAFGNYQHSTSSASRNNQSRNMHPSMSDNETSPCLTPRVPVLPNSYPIGAFNAAPAASLKYHGFAHQELASVQPYGIAQPGLRQPPPVQRTAHV